jgi:hypothetical protein
VTIINLSRTSFKHWHEKVVSTPPVHDHDAGSVPTIFNKKQQQNNNCLQLLLICEKLLCTSYKFLHVKVALREGKGQQYCWYITDGIHFWRALVFIELLARHLPKIGSRKDPIAVGLGITVGKAFKYLSNSLEYWYNYILHRTSHNGIPFKL